jgi:hypothetical protein
MVSKHRAFVDNQQSAPTPQLISEVSLLKLLNLYKAPLSLFPTIQKWAHKSVQMQHAFTCSFRQRDLVLLELEDQFDMLSSRFKPMLVSYLPDERPTVVYVSSFADAVYSLLSDPELMDEDNLSFPHHEHPFCHEPTQGSIPAISPSP